MNARPDAPRILLVEDEQHLAAGLKLNLELEGYGVDIAGSAKEAAQWLLRPSGYTMIILDVMLPDLDGFTLCARIREAGNFTPVLMLTARGRTEDRVQGLEAGADDYLAKPFELSELLARVRSLIRRTSWARDHERRDGAGSPVLVLGPARIDFDAQEATVRGEPIHLTALEFQLIRYFAENPGRVLSRQELQESVWKLRNYPSSRMVDNFIMRLRRHFEPDPSEPIYFVSVRGAGYKFIPPAGVRG